MVSSSAWLHLSSSVGRILTVLGVHELEVAFGEAGNFAFRRSTFLLFWGKSVIHAWSEFKTKTEFCMEVKFGKEIEKFGSSEDLLHPHF